MDGRTAKRWTDNPTAGQHGVSLAGAATSIIFVPTKILSRQMFCSDRHVFVTTKHIFCRDKSMLAATNLSHDKIMFVATNVMLR